MYSNHQNVNSIDDDLDPDNLDVEDMVRKRWKQMQGNVVGMTNNRLPPFRKQFLDPKQAINQEMSEAIKEFIKNKEIAIKSLDGQKHPHPFLTWDSTQFHKPMLNTINKLNFKSPTPIQSVVFPIILSGYDVIGVAETGSGKTFGYLLPGLIQITCQNYPDNFRNQINGPEMLILAPTRELVMQIKQQVEKFTDSYNLKVASAFGGQNREEQKRQILNNPNILVACPGRLRDFLQERILDLSKVTYLVIDEADRLLDMGFEDDVRFIVEQTRVDRQTVFFSATWPKAVRNLSFDFCCEQPVYVQIGRSNLTINKNIDQEIICLFNNEKLQKLFDILDSLKISDKVLIFAETRRSCEQLSVDMTNEGYYAVALHGDKSQYQRDQIMKNYKLSETKLLCATDLASRGLDVSDITVVINYDFPRYFDDYIHRIGRTGRAGRKGRAFSFFSIGKDQPQMARELLKFHQVHQIKFDFQLMQDLANGIKQFRNQNIFQGTTKYDGQIMNGKNKSIFTVPYLSEEQRANLYLQPSQYDQIQNRNNQNTYRRQNQGRPNNRQHNNRQNQRGEEFFFQDKFRNQGQNEQRRQYEQNWKSNRFGQQSDFQGQRREDYLDFGRDRNDERDRYNERNNRNNERNRNNGRDYDRQGYEKNQPRFGFQGSDYPRQDNNRWQNNGEDNQRQQFNYNREDRFDQQQQQNPFTQQRFSNQEKDQPYANQRNEQYQPYTNQKEERYQHFNNQREERQQQPFNNQREERQQTFTNQNFERQQPYQRDERTQPFTNSRDYQQQSRPEYNFNRDQQSRAQLNQNYQFNDQRQPDFNSRQSQNNQRDFQNDQQRIPYNNSRYQQQEQNSSSRNGFDNFQNDRGYENQRFQNQNYRQQNKWSDRDNNQGYPQRQYDQQQSRNSAQDNQWNRNYDRDYQKTYNQRFSQDDKQYNQNQRSSNYQNDDQRPNNKRNFVDVSQPQDDQQIRKDSSQQQDSTITPNFNNYKSEENQIQEKQNNLDINQQNQDQNERSQNQRDYDFRQNDNFNRDQGLSSNTRPQKGDQGPYMKQEQQFFNQQFEKPAQNNFFNERFQNQPQSYKNDRQNGQNQRSLLDQKMDQMPQYLENQRQNNERQNFIQQQKPQNIYQSFNRNERVQDDQDDDQLDFNRYSRETDEANKKFEFEQASKQNQQELKNIRDNSDQQQNQNFQQNNKLDSEDKY